MMQRLRNEPLTINRLVVVLGVYFFISQGISWWRSSNVEPKAFETLSAQVATLTTEMRDLKQLFKDKQQGDNFYYFSLCYSWRQKFPIQYPRFCDNPDIQQFDPTGRAIAPPR